MCFEMIGNLFIFVVACVAVYLRDSFDVAFIGLVVIYVIDIIGVLFWVICIVFEFEL